MRSPSPVRAASLPLSALLSQALVAFTIEFDNEFEHRMPHRTTMGGGQSGPWLTSMAMYANLLRLVSDEGITVRQLERQARTPMLQFRGMERWGYIRLMPDPADKRPKPPQRDWLVTLKSKGRMAKQVWAGLCGEIEARWRQRFGNAAIGELRASLGAVVNRLGLDLPEYLPVLGYGLVNEVLPQVRNEERSSGDPAQMTLPALLSKTLLAFALEFERESPVSIAIGANVLRLLGSDPLRVRDLPKLSGVSKESIAMATGFLRAKKFAVIEPDATSRGKAIQLTDKGLEAREIYTRLLQEIVQGWEKRFGKDEINRLRITLEQIIDAEENGQSLLWRGMEPYPDGWRAKIARPSVLPQYPMVLHRGGYPDGS